MIGTIIGVITIWHILGITAYGVIIGFGVEYIDYAEGLEFLNPIYIHKQARVNWFGAIMLMLFYSALCPLAAIVYWFYKLCTVGAK